MQEIICRFSKDEEVKWVSQLETVRVLERALRRAEIPIAYTQGFNPRPRLAMGPALPAGMTSQAELAALFLSHRMDAEELKKRLNAQLPPGFSVDAAWAIPAYKKKQTLGEIDTAEYVAAAKGPIEAEELDRRAVGLLSCREIRLVRQREKKTQKIDLRPWILALSIAEVPAGAQVKMTLRTGNAGGARPQEVFEQLGISGPEWQVSCHRQALYAGSAQTAARPRRMPLRSLHNSRFRRRSGKQEPNMR